MKEWLNLAVGDLFEGSQRKMISKVHLYIPKENFIRIVSNDGRIDKEIRMSRCTIKVINNEKPLLATDGLKVHFKAEAKSALDELNAIVTEKQGEMDEKNSKKRRKSSLDPVNMLTPSATPSPNIRKRQNFNSTSPPSNGVTPSPISPPRPQNVMGVYRPGQINTVTRQCLSLNKHTNGTYTHHSHGSKQLDASPNLNKAPPVRPETLKQLGQQKPQRTIPSSHFFALDPTSDISRSEYGSLHEKSSAASTDKHITDDYGWGNYGNGTTLKRKHCATVLPTVKNFDEKRSASYSTYATAPPDARAETDNNNYISRYFGTTPITSSRSVPKHIMKGGIPNLGNTCYMGSIVQALLSLRHSYIRDLLSDFTTTILATSSSKYEKSVAQELAALARHRDSALSIAPLKAAIELRRSQFCGHRQHDAHELLGVVIDAVDEDISGTKGDSCSTPTTTRCVEDPIATVDNNRIANSGRCCNNRESSTVSTPPPPSPPTTPAIRRLSSTVEICLQCCSCKKQRTMKEDYRDFSLELPSSSISASIQHLFNSHFKEEVRELPCEYCGDAQGKVKVTNHLVRRPDVLIIHLKRFSVDSSLKTIRKNDVDIRLNATLTTKEVSPHDASEADLRFDLGAEILDYEGAPVSTDSANTETAPDELNAAHEGNGTCDMWACDKCTFLNPTDFLTCSMCSEMKTSDVQSNEITMTCAEPDTDITEQSVDVVPPLLYTALPHHASPEVALGEYDLTAVVRHIGTDVSTGHYTCDVRVVEEHKILWKHCDDSIVSEITEDDVFKDSRTPYILFYTRNSNAVV